MINLTITIKEITAENWVDAVKLKVKEEQGNFVATNAVSIAQSKFQSFIECYGIYSKNEMVGFSAVGKNPEDDAQFPENVAKRARSPKERSSLTIF